MKYRTCPGCGWEYPFSFTKTKCKSCKTQFTEQICVGCKELKPTETFRKYKSGKNKGHIVLECKECNKTRREIWIKDNPEMKKARIKRVVVKRNARLEARFAEWLELTTLPFKPMTDAQWLETCAYFDGCAICGSEHIESRGFFLPFKEGGRYASWNMFPMCGTCATRTRSVKNPFRWVDNSVGTAKLSGLTPERGRKIIEYLTKQIEEASNVTPTD